MIQVTIVFNTKHKWNTFRSSWIFHKFIYPITNIKEYLCVDIREIN